MEEPALEPLAPELGPEVRQGRAPPPVPELPVREQELRELLAPPVAARAFRALPAQEQEQAPAPEWVLPELAAPPEQGPEPQVRELTGLGLRRPAPQARLERGRPH